MVKRALKRLGFILAVYLVVVDCVQHKQLTGSSHMKDLVGPSVLYIAITTPDGIPYHGGTGFEVEDSSGHRFIVTNKHVCGIFTGGVAQLQTEEGKVYFRHILKVSDIFDLCLIDSIDEVPALHLGKKISLLDKIFIVGHPFLHPLKVTSGNVIRSLVITTTEDGITSTGSFASLETNAEAHPGNSGSPVVNPKGEVVGVLFAGTADGETSFVVPLDDLKDFLR